MSEKDFWQEMKTGLAEAGIEGHFSRVESPQASAGIPDLDFCVRGVEGHIELKFGKDKKVPSIRPSQVKWFHDRIKNGGHPMIFAKIVIGTRVNYCFYAGSKVRELHEAKSNQDWVNLANVSYVVPYWDVFMMKIKDISRATVVR